MSSFYNEGTVHNQVGGNQNNYGPVFFGTFYNGSEKLIDGSTPISSNGLSALDNEVLTSLAFPQMQDRRNSVESAHPTTCQWILEQNEFAHWNSQPHGFLWIKGKPGAGKSTVMAFLYDMLKNNRQRQDVCIDFFFSARGSKLQYTPLGMLRSLLNQLFIQAPCIRAQIRDVYNEKQATFGRGQNTWEWQRRELEQLLKAAILNGATEQQTTIFVDALDEAGETAAREITKYFCSIYDSVVGLSKPRYAEIFVEDHNSADIAIYIRDSLDLTYIQSDSEAAAWDDLQTDLLDQANGVFQWVYLVVQLINKKAADGESPSDIRLTLRRVPNDLNAVYQYILQRVIDETSRRASLQLFQWVCFAQGPLTVTELRYALVCSEGEISGSRCHERPNFITTDERMKLRLKALSGGLVEVVSRWGYNINTPDRERVFSESVQVIHQSVMDFLRAWGLRLLEVTEDGSNGIQLPPPSSGPYSVDLSETTCQGHRMISQSCLHYLLIELREAIDGCSISRDYIVSQQYRFAWLDLAHDLRIAKEDIITEFPLISYAVNSLYDHIRRAGTIDASNLQNLAPLLQVIMLDWITMYNLLYPFLDNCPNDDSSLLHLASLSGATNLVLYLINSSVDVEVRDAYGNTALHLAARKGHYDVVAMLIKAGAEIDAVNLNHQTPIVLAAGAGQENVVKQLLYSSRELDTQNPESETALSAAAHSKNKGMVKILLAAGANINTCGGKYGTPLQAAAVSIGSEKVEMIELLLAAGADVNAHAGEYQTALQAAAAVLMLDTIDGNLDTIQILMAAGAEINTNGGKYGNPLQAATWSKHKEAVQVLLAAGAEVNAIGGMYGTALQAAAASQSGRNTELVEMLLAAGADVNAQGGLFNTALIAAAHDSSKQVVQILLTAGADVNIRSERYGNALQAALRKNRHKIVRILRNAGASEEAGQENITEYRNSIDERNSRGMTYIKTNKS